MYRTVVVNYFNLTELLSALTFPCGVSRLTSLTLHDKIFNSKLITCNDRFGYQWNIAI
jgi:hypothetical protein